VMKQLIYILKETLEEQGIRNVRFILNKNTSFFRANSVIL
jgi:hypothetical protein